MSRASLLGCVILVLVACASPIYPVTIGFRGPASPLMDERRPARFLLWPQQNDIVDREPTKSAIHELTTLLLQSGTTVVERDKVDRIFAEQRFRLTHTPDQEADLLQAGRMVGATQIIFVDAARDSPVKTMRVSVRLRSIDVQTGVMRWTGSASVSSDGGWSGMLSIQNPAGAAGWLAGWAFRRAICPTDAGWAWVEPNGDWGSPKPGCIPPAGQNQSS